jgi:hypothetical protein
MKQNEENIFEVLNTLSLLRNSRKNHSPKLPEEEQNILIVTKEHIAMTGLTVSTFINTLNQIAKKGYLYAICIYEKKYHEQFKKLSEPEVYEKSWTSSQRANKTRFQMLTRENILNP